MIGIDSNLAMLAQVLKRRFVLLRTLIQRTPDISTSKPSLVTMSLGAYPGCLLLHAAHDAEWTRAWDNVMPLLSSGARVETGDVAPHPPAERLHGGHPQQV